MDRKNREERGWKLAIAYAYIITLVVMGIYAGIQHDAEAVLGGSGNVTQDSNPHNFASTSTGIKAVTEKRVCIFCHTPHNAETDSALINGPLWNHTLSTQTYTNWGSGSLVNTPPYISNVGFVNMLTDQPAQPDGSSRMCMSCHDGTVGIGNTVAVSDISMDTTHGCVNSTDGSLIPTLACKGVTDLTTKHVVSVPMNLTLLTASAGNCDGSQTSKLSYPWAGDSPQANNVFLRPTATSYGGSTGVSSGLPANGQYSTKYSYGVQCSSCHDPHNWNAASGNEGYKFLVTDTMVKLCIACHDDCNP